MSCYSGSTRLDAGADVSEVSFEYVVSQLQSASTKILCVKDGVFLSSFDSTYGIPACLSLELIKTNELIDTTEFHYRNTVTDELWTFFDARVHRWFQGGCRGVVRLDGQAAASTEAATHTPIMLTDPEDFTEDLTGMQLVTTSSSDQTPVDQIFVTPMVRRR